MPTPDHDFEQAAQQKQESLISEFLGFLRQNKKYWLLPLLIILLMLAARLAVSSTAVAPFIYTLF